MVKTCHGTQRGKLEVYQLERFWKTRHSKFMPCNSCTERTGFFVLKLQSLWCWVIHDSEIDIKKLANVMPWLTWACANLSQLHTGIGKWQNLAGVSTHSFGIHSAMLLFVENWWTLADICRNFCCKVLGCAANLHLDQLSWILFIFPCLVFFPLSQISFLSGLLLQVPNFVTS